MLSVDEAYALAPLTDNDFGREAVETLMKAMEDRHDRFAVVAAGYDAQMRDFLQSNPGLRSRFSRMVLFDDYTAEELQLIFKRLCLKQGYEVGAVALEMFTSGLNR